MALAAALTTTASVAIVAVRSGHEAAAAGQPSVNIDQCRNGNPPVVCTGAAWVNGNLGSSNSHYSEGDSVPYRALFDNLVTGAAIHTVTIGWDTINSGKHALDYLTTYNRTELAADPCSGVAGCAGPGATFAIPPDANAVNQILGQVFTLFGGAITGVSAYSVDPPGSNVETRITVSFTASIDNPVLAWGGHIGTRIDWGEGNSAGGISGSPYHMRLQGFSDGNVGQQDRSLSADAIIIPATITIIKDAQPNDPQDFAFNGTGTGVTNFTLDDDGDATLLNTKQFGGLLTFGVGNPRVIAEPAIAGWALDSITCTSNKTNNNTISVASRNVSIVLEQGEDVVCTFVNRKLNGQLVVKKQVINDNGGTAAAAAFNLHVKSGGADVTGSPAAGSTAGTTYTLLEGPYVVSEDSPTPLGYARTGFSGDCDPVTGAVTLVAGQTKTCTIINNDIAPQLTVIKKVEGNTGTGGTAVSGDFTMTITSSDTPTIPGFPGADTPGTTKTVRAGSYAVGETGPSGYSGAFSADCSGTLALAQSKTCTVTNTAIQPQLKIVKVVKNDNGGTKQPSDFTINIAGNSPSPASVTGQAAPGATVSIKTGNYTVTEPADSGYATSYSSDCAGSIALGEIKTCTVTNDDKPGTLIVIKHVINDNGGLLDASKFPIAVTGAVPSPASFAGAESPGVSVTINAGGYSVSETEDAAYTASYSADCTGTIANGATKTCTITNNDKPAKLTVIKNVINDNGGQASRDQFTMTVTAQNPSNASFPGSTGTTITLDAGAFSVGETGPAGYAASYSADCAGSIVAGQSKTCTVTNDDIAPKLTVTKVVINDDGGSKVIADFPLFVDALGVTSGVQGSFTVGTYTVSETSASGYTAKIAGDCAADGTITLALADVKACTITNDDIAPKLTVTKVVINNNGGTKGVSDFPLFVDAGSVTSGVQNTLKAGAHSVSETGSVGYTATISGDCAANGSITLAPGDVKACTITNDDVAPKLTVTKVVINNNGGTKGVSDFPLFVDAGSVTSGVQNTVDAGSHTVSETSLQGYAATISGDCAANGSITLAPGDVKACTITNDDIAPKLTVTKKVVNSFGGTAGSADFTMTVKGNAPDPASFPGDENGTPVKIGPGAYAVSESGPSGYSGAFSADCDSTIDIGDDKTCVVTNSDQQPKLTVIKKVVNDDGGQAKPGDFMITVTGTNVSGSPFPGDASGTTVTLNAGSFSVSESTLPGYSQTKLEGDCSGKIGVGQSFVCTITNDDVAPKLTVIKKVKNSHGGLATSASFTISVTGNPVAPVPFPGSAAGTTVALAAGAYSVSESSLAGYVLTSASADCQGKLVVGDEKTCTLVNEDQPVKLTVIKHVINDDGGTKTAGDFTMNVAGTNPSSGTFAGDEAGTTITLDAGAFNVGETALDGYAQKLSGDCAGTIAVGDAAKTCTVTNDDIAGTLIVIKHVINDNGGTADANAFKITVTAGQPVPASFNGAEAPGVKVSVSAGKYSVAEVAVDGYQPTYGSDCAGMIGLAETKTCTITNDDQPGTLIVVKKVVNDDGGSAKPGDFKITVTGEKPDPASFNGADTPGTNVTIDAGKFSVSEQVVTGYQPTYVGCEGVIAIGVTKMCTITNDDVAPKLIVTKIVVNDDGGTKNISDFPLFIDGHAVTSGSTTAVKAGSHTVSETGLASYSGTIGDACDKDGKVVLALAETKSCTITNDDIAPKLTVIKVVDNQFGGSAKPEDFTMTVSGTDVMPASSFAGSSSGVTVSLDAGSFAVTESSLAGYAGSASGSCSGTIAIGEVKTCTYTNAAQPPKLIVIKKVINDNGGTKVASDFKIGVTASSPSPSSFAGASAPGSTVTLNVGDYQVTEADPTSLGYAVKYSDDCTGTVKLGETKTCTITNDDIAPKLTVIKVVINDHGGTKVVSDFALFVDGVSVTSGVSNTVKAGSHTVSETGLASYAGSIGGDCAADGKITLALAEVKACTITNDDIAPKLVVIKHVVNGPKVAADFTIKVSGVSVSPASFPGKESPGTNVALKAGAYSVSEVQIAPYVASLSAGCSGTIALGETKTCTITNTYSVHPGTIGFWRNWNNHYTSSQFNTLLNYLRVNNPKVYGTAPNLVDQARIGAIYNYGSGTPREQQVLGQLTAVKLNLAVTAVAPTDGPGGIVQKNDNLCLTGKVDVSSIGGAAALFGTSAPTIKQVVDYVEGKWSGALTTTRADWKFNLTAGQLSTLIGVLSGINEGTIVIVTC